MSEAATEDTSVVGLVAESGLPIRLARRLVGGLADRLDHAIPHRRPWQVEAVERSLRLNRVGQIPAVTIGGRLKDSRGWAAAVVLTDLPRSVDDRPMIADYSAAERTSMVSVPALGASLIRRRAERLITALIAAQLRDGNTTADETELADEPALPDEQQSDAPTTPTAPPAPTGASAPPARTPSEEERRTIEAAAHLLDRMPGPVRHVPSTVDGVDTTLALVGLRGRLRMVAGMVRSNRPWLLIPSLAPAIAASAAGAAFGIFYSSIWQLSDALSNIRLALITVLVLAAMVCWLLLYNNLLDRRAAHARRAKMVLFNSVTIATVSSACLLMYALLYTATFASALIVIPSSVLQSTIGHAVSIGDYATEAWLAA